MTDENTIIEPGDAENQQPEETKPEPKKSNLMKYIIFGASGLILIIAIAFGVGMMFSGSDHAEQPVTTEPAVTEEHQSEQATINKPERKSTEQTSTDNNLQLDETELEQLAEAESEYFDPNEIDVEIPDEEYDDSAIDKIMANLEFLDYQPEADEIQDESMGMSVEDSLEQVNWLKQEKKKLAQREADVKKREQELLKLEKEVNAKLTRIDQIESSRIGKLAKLYDSMESRAVAKLMMNLDDNTVVSILPKMKNKNAASVLQLMPSQRAARLSKQLITIAGS